MMHDWYYGSGSDIVGFVFMFLVMAALVIGGVFAIRYLARSNKAPRDNDALEILKKRYANGEIDKEEFEQKRNDLSQ